MEMTFFKNESDETFFDEYIRPQFDINWKNWIETKSKKALALCLFWLDSYAKLEEYKHFKD